MAKNHLISLSTENTEVIIDHLLEDGFVKEIPIVSTIANAIAVGKSVRDILFARKLARFLNGINDISETDHQKIRNFALSDDAEEISEKLLNVLDTNSELSKSEIIANVFLGFIDGLLTASELKVILEVIEKSYSDDLNNFLRTLPTMGSHVNHLQRAGISHLMNSPLMEQKPRLSTRQRRQEDTWKQIEESKEVYRTTPLGKRFRRAHSHGLIMRGKDSVELQNDPNVSNENS